MNNLRWIFMVLTATMLFACKAREELNHTGKVNRKDLVEAVHEARLQYQFLSFRSTVTANIDGDEKTFKAVIRIQKDSIIWVSLKPLVGGIEAARLVITQDSVKLMDRLNKRFVLSDMSMLEAKTGVSLNFETLEKLMVGAILETSSDKPKISYSRGENTFLVSSFKEKKLYKKVEKYENAKKEKEKHDVVFQSSWIDGANLQVTQLSVNDVKGKKELVATYTDFTFIGTPAKGFPKQMTYKVVGLDNWQVSCENSRISVEDYLKFPFSIPDKYEQAIF